MEEEKGVAAIDERGGKEEPLGLKLRRGISAAKRGGPCTPVPTWKLEEPGPSDPGSPDKPRAAAPRRSSASARQLGANLWEIQDLLPAAVMSRRSGRARRRREGKALDDGGEDPDPPPISPAARPKSASSFKRHIATSLIQHHKLNEKNGQSLQAVSPASYSSSKEIAAFNQAITPSSSLDFKGKFGEAGYSLKTSAELLKVLNRIWSLEEQHASNVSLVKALKMELEHARARIQELMQERKAYRHEMDDLMKQVAQDKLLRKIKEQERVKAAVQSIRDELEDERRLRRRSENLHRKLGKELSELNAAFMKALKDLERERKANDLLENLCDEFAKGIRDYELEVRELQQKNAKDCDHKVDRLVLHISEAWLDERIQMEVAEAQGNMTEMSTITDRLSGEIKTFLQARRSSNSKNDALNQKGERRDSNLRRQSLESLHLNGATSAPQDIDDDDSVASDMHCFELNMGDKDNEHLGQLRPHGGNCITKLDSTRKPNLTGKKMGYSERAKVQNPSSLQLRIEEPVDKMKPCCGNDLELVDGLQRVNSRTDVEYVGVGADQIEIGVPHKSENHHVQGGQELLLKFDGMHGSNHAIGSVKNLSEISGSSKVHHVNYHGENSCSHFSWRDHFALAGEDTAPADFRDLSSPVQQWNYRHTSPDFEISECSSKLPHGVKENTLKAKLLEARLEGQHARLKAPKGSFISGMRQ